jgi:acetylornithine deacetylase/succinyl-diaminopimelate desuccinylase-like protein
MTAAATSMDVDQAELAELAAQLCRYPSALPDEAEVSRFLAGAMRELGCFDEVIEQHVLGGRCNVIGVLRGTSAGGAVLLNGHLDTPMLLDGWTRDPYGGEIHGGRVYGLGVSDMKGAVASMVAASAALARSGVERPRDVVLSAVIHHDTVGLGTKFFLDSWDRPIAACVNGEPTDLRIQTAHGGAWQFELETRGRPAHNCRQEEGVDAIAAMGRVLDRLSVDRLTFDPATALPGLPRIVVGTISGGVSPSRTAARCRVTGDLRIADGMTQESVTADVQALLDELAAEDPDFHATVRCLAYQRPFRGSAESPMSRAVAQAHQAICRSGPVITDGLPMSAAVTDASDLSRRGIDTVVYGPGDWTVDPDESVAIDDLVTAARVYAEAIVIYSNGGAG